MQSRNKAASLADKEILLLYFGIEEYISENTRNMNWGKRAIDIIPNSLHQELFNLEL